MQGHTTVSTASSNMEMTLFVDVDAGGVKLSLRRDAFLLYVVDRNLILSFDFSADINCTILQIVFSLVMECAWTYTQCSQLLLWSVLWSRYRKQPSVCVRLDEWLCFKFICMNSNSKIFSYSAESDVTQ